MLYKIKTQTEVQSLPNHLPPEVVDEAMRVAEIIDTHYNSQGIDGGFILIAEDKASLEKVRQDYLDYTQEIYEFKDSIGEWMSILYLIGTEYSITLITKNSLMYTFIDK